MSRVHGGAYIEGGTTNEINISLRRTTHSAQKQQIAAVCERIIQNGDSIFLDSSTTANYIAEKLTNYRLTVLTNSIHPSAYPNAMPTPESGIPQAQSTSESSFCPIL